METVLFFPVFEPLLNVWTPFWYTEKIKQQRLKEYAEKKAAKPAVTAKSQVILDVKVRDRLGRSSVPRSSVLIHLPLSLF